jgi:hypothetical protein
MGAPSPELVDLWLARAFNAQDIEAAAAMYHPDARVVRLQHIHGNTYTGHWEMPNPDGTPGGYSYTAERKR